MITQPLPQTMTADPGRLIVYENIMYTHMRTIYHVASTLMISAT